VHIVLKNTVHCKEQCQAVLAREDHLLAKGILPDGAAELCKMVEKPGLESVYSRPTNVMSLVKV
jgi:hypothetical protein